MTPQERELIQGVFDRLARSGTGAKDAEAEALIRESVARQPDAAYGLVQAVIVQELGLNQAQQKITELQRQLDDARSHTTAQPAAGGGSFLGGLLSPWGGGSVPRSGAPNAAPSQAQAPFSPAWAGTQQPQQQPGAWGQQQPASGAGGFLRSAATMAAGVAGGTLIAEGLSSMFGGHHGGFGGFGGGFGGGSPWGNSGGTPTEIVENTTVNNYYGDQDTQDASADTGVQDASYDDASYDDGGDDGGDDSSDV